MAANEIRSVTGFIVSRLSGDATLVGLGVTAAKIFDDYAPQNVTGPLVVVTLMSALDRNGLPATVRIQTDMLYLVKAVHESGSKLVADQIADRIDTLLMDYGGTADVGALNVGRFYRERAVSMTEVTPTGQVFRHVGANYRTVISTA